MNKSNFSAVDLFAGCGGLTLGLKQAGFSVLGAIEIDKNAVETYRLNHPEINIRHQNICEVSEKGFLRSLTIKKGDLDLLAGCPPCQGFSTLRTLNGGKVINDCRNDLVFHFLRFVKAAVPKCIMLENVPGLAKDSRFETLLNILSNYGYTVNWSILDAADFAVPQRRKRLILVASRFNKINFARKARKRYTVADAIKWLPNAGDSGDHIHDLPENRSEHIKHLIQSIPKNGGSRTDLPYDRQLTCHKNCNGFKDVYGRMYWNDVSPTMTTGCFNPSKGRFLHPDENRNITMREAALLQSFPINYKFPANLGKTTLAQLIGNALPPEFIRRQANQIRRHIIKPRISQ